MTATATYYLILPRHGRESVRGVYTVEWVARQWARKLGGRVVAAESATDADRATIAEYHARQAELFGDA